MLVKLAIFILRRAMLKDPDYAWSWHCNIAMVARDAATDVFPGCDVKLHKRANVRAGDFMRNLFGVETNKFAEK